MAKAVARKITIGEPVTVTLTKDDGTQIGVHSFTTSDIITVRREDKS